MVTNTDPPLWAISYGLFVVHFEWDSPDLKALPVSSDFETVKIY